LTRRGHVPAAALLHPQAPDATRPLHFGAVATERVKLAVKGRAERGSAANRRLRRQGLVPGILYGHKVEPRAFVVPEADLRHALSGEHGAHAILDVVVDDEKRPHPAVLREYQRDPVKGGLLHVDLHVVRLDQPIHASVAIALVGEALGAKAGGVVTPSARELNVEALPAEVPDQIEVDVSLLEIGDSLHLSDLAPIEDVLFLDDPETLLVSVTLPTRAPVEEEEVVEEAEEEAAEGEEAEAEAAGETETSSE
jgi:large subunit ribosomal protein L25